MASAEYPPVVRGGQTFRACCESSPGTPGVEFLDREEHLPGCPATRSYEIAWTFGGYTTVRATSREEAREIFQSAIDHTETLRECHASQDGGLEVVDVNEATA